MKKNIPSTAGVMLENYKNWYYLQPKLIRIIILPFILGFCFLILGTADNISALAETAIILIFLITFLWNLYNQYLDNLLSEDISNIKSERDYWKTLTKNLIFLNQTLKILIDSKSEMFGDTVSKASEVGKKGAIVYVKERNSLKNNVNRIIAALYKIVEKYTDEQVKIRITYLVPDNDGNKLTIKSWYNDDNAPPYS